MASTQGQIAMITGASSGIGRAIAVSLAERGLRPCLTGRHPARLAHVADELASRGSDPVAIRADLASDDGIRELVEAVKGLGRLDVLVHGAGAIRLGDIMITGWDDLDELYRVNVRAPYLLTRSLLPMLVETRGQIVFVNSTAALQANADNGLYAATKDALQGLADSISDRVNPLGVRVLTVFPGRTATPMQERVHAFEGKRYDPTGLLQPSDVANVVVQALMQSRTAEVTDVTVLPATRPSNTRRVR